MTSAGDAGGDRIAHYAGVLTMAPGPARWVRDAAIRAGESAAATFLAIEATAGVHWLSMPTLKAALAAGGAAAIATLDALVANVVNPTSTSTLKAVSVRRAEARHSRDLLASLTRPVSRDSAGWRP